MRPGDVHLRASLSASGRRGGSDCRGRKTTSRYFFWQAARQMGAARSESMLSTARLRGRSRASPPDMTPLLLRPPRRSALDHKDRLGDRAHSVARTNEQRGLGQVLAAIRSQVIAPEGDSARLLGQERRRDRSARHLGLAQQRAGERSGGGRRRAWGRFGRPSEGFSAHRRMNDLPNCCSSSPRRRSRAPPTFVRLEGRTWPASSTTSIAATPSSMTSTSCSTTSSSCASTSPTACD